MVRLTDQIVAGWDFVVWEQNDQVYKQVRAFLMNGLTIILNTEDFFEVCYDDYI